MKTVLTNDYVRFLYPTSRQFPFDEVCEAIVRKAEERNWEIPGFEFIFDEYGKGQEKYRFLKTIIGEDFYLHFCRVQEHEISTEFNDIAGISTIAFPGFELHVYEDESGPTLYTYVGKDWSKDKKDFMGGTKIHAKKDGKERTYLVYNGNWQKPGEEPSVRPYDRDNRRPPYLVNYDDLGRTYAAEGKEPKFYSTDKIFFSITKWLKNYVLRPIENEPIPIKTKEYFIPEEKIPWPEKFGPLFTYVGGFDFRRIEQGKESRDKLTPKDRYGLRHSYRLVSLDISNDGTVPDIAYEGFIWCAFFNPETNIAELDIPGLPPSLRLSNIVQINPESMNHIFIVDNWKRREYMVELFKNDKNKKHLSPEEYNELRRVSARTIIPISEYQGDFKEPVVLIQREISLDEVEIIKKSV